MFCACVLRRLVNSVLLRLQGALLNTAVSKSARLDEFEQSQSTAITAFATMTKDNWCTAVRNHIKVVLVLLPHHVIAHVCDSCLGYCAVRVSRR